MRRRAVILSPQAMKQLEQDFPEMVEVTVEITSIGPPALCRLILKGRKSHKWTVWKPLSKR